MLSRFSWRNQFNSKWLGTRCNRRWMGGRSSIKELAAALGPLYQFDENVVGPFDVG